MRLLVRYPFLTACLAAIAVMAISLLAVLAAFHVAGEAVLPIVLFLSIVMPLLMTPLALYPLLAMNRDQQDLSLELRRQAATDALTELPNRRAFFDFARSIIERPPVSSLPLAAMMIDVDFFKRINDSYGHDHGDMVLKRVASVIRTEVAEATAPAWIVARLGGEEFGIITDGLVASAVGRLAERICAQVHLRVGAGDRLEPVTVSIGVAFRRPGMKIDRLLKEADDAVYTAKRAGRDRWAFASADDTSDPDARWRAAG
jgi:diguanylate cyclase